MLEIGEHFQGVNFKQWIQAERFLIKIELKKQQPWFDRQHRKEPCDVNVNNISSIENIRKQKIN